MDLHLTLLLALRVASIHVILFFNSGREKFGSADRHDEKKTRSFLTTLFALIKTLRDI